MMLFGLFSSVSFTLHLDFKAISSRHSLQSLVTFIGLLP